MTETLLLDNAAWTRLGDPALDDERVAELADALEDGPSPPACPSSSRPATPFGVPETTTNSANGSPSHFTIDETSNGERSTPQRQLARVGHHRLPPVDVLVAATADRRRLGVLHYEETDLDFDSVWLAARGTI